jgi:hypothetical protein
MTTGLEELRVHAASIIFKLTKELKPSNAQAFVARGTNTQMTKEKPDLVPSRADIST